VSPREDPGLVLKNFQGIARDRSEDLPQTRFPGDETLRRLGIDPATKDRTLDPSPVSRQGATGAGVSH